jgi:recyclin-1
LKSSCHWLESVVTTTTNEVSQPSQTQLDLFLSLDVAVELVHADRESLKRVETFSGYLGHYGFRVRDTIEEAFVLLVRALAGHIEGGFRRFVGRLFCEIMITRAGVGRRKR